jgi:NADPH:quinone reductase
MRGSHSEMRAAWYDRAGRAEEVLIVGETARPLPGPGEVLIRMRAAGVNPVDVRRRAGWTGAGYAQSEKRVVPHTDGAGIVEALGEGVDQYWADRRVWVWNAGSASFYGFPQHGTDNGTAAEYVALPIGYVAQLPDTADFDVGACLGGPACTAHYVVLGDGDVSGSTILVQGGTGSVGELAVQFAAEAGANVIAVVSSDEKAEMAKASGARHTVNRSRERVDEAVLELCPNGVDRIIEVEFGLNVETDAKLIKPNGKIASFSSPSAREPVLPYYSLQRKGITVHFVQAYILPHADRKRAIDAIHRLLKTKRLRPTIAARYSLDQIAAAHAHVESGRAIGNVIVEMN